MHQDETLLAGERRQPYNEDMKKVKTLVQGFYFFGGIIGALLLLVYNLERGRIDEIAEATRVNSRSTFELKTKVSDLVSDIAVNRTQIQGHAAAGSHVDSTSAINLLSLRADYVEVAMEKANGEREVLLSKIEEVKTLVQGLIQKSSAGGGE